MGSYMSLPLRGCGLKFVVLLTLIMALTSLPLRGCGLKYIHDDCSHGRRRVTPLAGVWIEIDAYRAHNEIILSLPLRGCGLK